MLVNITFLKLLLVLVTPSNNFRLSSDTKNDQVLYLNYRLDHWIVKLKKKIEIINP